MKTIVVFKLTGESGLFSVFFFLVKAYIFAKKYGFDFYIECDNWPYTFDKGWHDYFNSLKILDSTIEYRSVIYYSHPASIGAEFKTNPITREEFKIEEYIQAIHEIYVLKDELLEKANNIISSFNNTDYISLFVRRGDKISSKESPFFPLSEIISYCGLPNYKNIFVQSDTYEVVDELKSKLPNINIFSTVPKFKMGSFHENYFKMTPIQRKNDIEEVLIGLHICLKSKLCWTDDLSNVGRFLKLFDLNKVNLYPLRHDDYDKGFYNNKKIDISLKIICPAYTNFNDILLNKSTT